MRAIFLISCLLGAAPLLLSQRQQLFDTTGSARRVFSCQGSHSQGFQLTNSLDTHQTGSVHLVDPRNLNSGILAPLNVHLGSRAAPNKMVFLLSQRALDFTQRSLDQYLQDTAERYVGVQIETHPPGVPDELSLLLKSDTGKPKVIGPVPAYGDGREMERDMPAQYHALTVLYDSKSAYLSISIGEEVRIIHCQDLVKEVLDGNPQIYIGMAGATYAVPDSQQVCLRSSDFAFNCCPVMKGCFENADLEQGWYSVGRPAHSGWLAEGSRVIQQKRTGASIFMLPVSMYNVRMHFKVKVNSSGANQQSLNNWGFVMGMTPPKCDTTLHNYWLFDWRGDPATLCNGRTAQAGYSLSRVNGKILTGCGPGESVQYFGEHRDDSNILNVVQHADGTPSWQFDTVYQFEVLYTFDRIEVKINGKVVAEHTGCFSPGNFGFFTYEQQNVEFSKFSYEHLGYFSTADTDTVICQGVPIRFAAYNACNNRMDALQNRGIQWKFGDGESTGFLTGQERIFDTSYAYKEPGIFELAMIIKDANNCPGEVRQKMIVLPSPDTLELATTQAGCTGVADGSVTVLNPPPDLMYAINNSGMFSQTTSYKVGAGKHILNIQNAEFCSLDQPFTIESPQAIGVELNAVSAIPLGDTVKLTAVAQLNGAPLRNYTWSTGAVCKFCRIISERSLVTTTYRVTITDTLDCTATDTITVMVLDSMRLYIPNVFSPNGNGYNDYFTIFGGPQIEKIALFRVFDRWGALLHEARDFQPGDPDFAWKGFDKKGRWLPPGVYVGYVEITFIDGREKLVKYFDITLTL